MHRLKKLLKYDRNTFWTQSTVQTIYLQINRSEFWVFVNGGRWRRRIRLHGGMRFGRSRGPEEAAGSSPARPRAVALGDYQTLVLPFHDEVGVDGDAEVWKEDCAEQSVIWSWEKS